MELVFLADWGLGIFLLAVSFWVRAISFPIETPDYIYFVSKWFDALAHTPGLEAFIQPFSDYAPAYLYALKTLTFLPFHSLYATKGLSVLFDIVIGLAVVGILYILGIRSKPRLFLAFAVVVSLPTLVLNSSVWGQSDAIYAAFILISLGFILADRPLGAAIAYALAFAIKFQAIFFLPVIVGYLFWRKETFSYILIIPVTLFLFVIPAWFSGGSFTYWFLIYATEASQYLGLSLFAPSMFAFVQPLIFSADVYTVVFWIGLVCAAITAIGIAITMARSGLSSLERMLLLSLICVTLIPFLLPRMHERYFFVADVISTVYALYRPSKWYLPVLIVGASALSYLPYLSQTVYFASFSNFDVRISAAMMFVALVLMLWNFVHLPEINSSSSFSKV